MQKNTHTIFVLPTDTLYGICASAFDKKAVERIYRIKGRDDNKPFIILISSFHDLQKFGIKLSPFEKRFFERVWPGKVSVILPCPNPRFRYLHRGTKSLAFRMPKKKSLQKILKKTGPLVAPSANPQGMKPAETVAEAKRYFGNEVGRYISNRRRLTSKPSTVLELKHGRVNVVRQGAVRVKLEDVIG